MFQEALIESVTKLEAARRQGVVRDFALIGGFAVAAWGVPRATHDLDFAVAVGSADPHSTARFLDGQYEAGEPDDPLSGVIHLTIGPPHEVVPLQLVLFPPALTELLFRDVEQLFIMDHVVPTVSWQALVILKLYAGGPQDRLDAEQILRAKQPHEQEWARLRSMADSVGLSKEWQALADAWR